MKKEHKILFIIGNLDAGGTETYLLRFLKYLNNKYNVTVLCTYGKKGSLYEQYKLYCNKLDIFRLGSTNPFLWIKFYFYLKKNKFNTICDFNGNFAGINMLISTICKCNKRITFYRQTNDLIEKNFMFFSINKIVKSLVYKYSTHILSNSKTAFNLFYPHIQDIRFKVIYNGINSELFNFEESKEQIRKSLNIPINKFVVGHTGRYHEVKNQITIIDVAEILCQEIPDVMFVLCGRGVVEKFSPIIKSRKLLNNFLLLNERNDIPRILKSFDMYYFPSTSEGQPNALIEAMLSGLPILVSNIEPILETIPTFLYNRAVEPFDINSSINIIKETIRNKQENNMTKSTIDYSINKYCYHKRFFEFEEILIN